MLHFYSDESAGSLWPRSGYFVIATVAVPALVANRTIKSFRKATRWQGEVKGTAMTSDLRRTLLGIAFKDNDTHGVARFADRSSPLIGWALDAHRESTIYTQAVIEGAHHILTLPGTWTKTMGFTMDTGRYPGPQQRLVRDGIRDGLAVKRPVDFAESQSHAGLQIADVLANAVQRKLNGWEDVVPEKVDCRPVLLEDLTPPFWVYYGSR
jgi:hypothetical protein